MKIITTKPKEHPWMDDACFATIESKCLATGTDDFGDRKQKCSGMLTAAYLRYQSELRGRLFALGHNSKEWFRVNRQLLNCKTKASSIPPLKNDRGKWILDRKEKG